MTRQLFTLADAVHEREWTKSAGKDPTRWLRRLIEERRLPFHKVAGRVLIDIADLDALADRGRREPSSAA